MRTNNGPMLFSLTLMLAAPLVVVTTLLVARSVWLTFLLYHLGVCLVAPALARRSRPAGWRAHLNDLGLRPGGVRLGLVLGVGSALTIWGAFARWGDTFLASAAVRDALRQWGVTSGSMPALFAFMLLGNGMAEELFWRGWLHERLRVWPSRPAAIAAVAACYVGYHVFTVATLLRDLRVIVLFTAVIMLVAGLWGWLRERTGTVWPALLGHTGATAGYMLVLWLWVLRGAA